MALTSKEIAQATLEMGERKVQLGVAQTLVLGILAGMYIALGALFYTIVTTAPALGFGPTRLLGGLVFSLGLILVVIAGAELFTGNNLIIVATLAGRVSLGRLLRNWALVYLGNFIGSLLVVVLVWGSGVWRFSGAGVGSHMVEIAAAKATLPAVEAFTRAILCNALVCLAVWMALGAESVAGKILAIVFPITAFVAMGFEHSVANMYFIPMGLCLKGQAEVRTLAAEGLTWAGFAHNLGWVTLGNLVGGLLVGALYFLVWLGAPSTNRAAMPRSHE